MENTLIFSNNFCIWNYLTREDAAAKMTEDHLELVRSAFIRYQIT